MKERHFKVRVKDYVAIKAMTDKQAGELIKNLCLYAFEGVIKESKDAKVASAYAYARTVMDNTAQSSFYGKKGALISQERRKQTERTEEKAEQLLKGVVLTALDGVSKAMEKKNE